jgi:hypothetical protein
MRELLDEGALIKEAVKRLQLKTTSSGHSCDFDTTLEDICDTVIHCATNKKLDDHADQE